MKLSPEQLERRLRDRTLTTAIAETLVDLIEALPDAYPPHLTAWLAAALRSDGIRESIEDEVRASQEQYDEDDCEPADMDDSGWGSLFTACCEMVDAVREETAFFYGQDEFMDMIASALGSRAVQGEIATQMQFMHLSRCRRNVARETTP